jgi:hypothetical protein
LPGHDLVQHFEPLRHQPAIVKRDAGDVAAGPVEALDAARVLALGIPPLARNPITGFVSCCARAVSGQAAAAPARLMNWRRLTSHPCKKAVVAVEQGVRKAPMSPVLQTSREIMVRTRRED